jgi:curved DNA-binding protein CbpA
MRLRQRPVKFDLLETTVSSKDVGPETTSPAKSVWPQCIDVIGNRCIFYESLFAGRCFESVPMRTLYDLLGVGSDADDAALSKAYRKAAKEHHPDLNAGDPDASRRFRQIATAIEILRDAEQRAAYDRLLDHERAQERQQRRLRRTRIIIADAIATAVLIVVLAGGYALIGSTFSTSTTASKGGNGAMPGPVAMVAEQRTQRTEPTGADEPRSRLEQSLTVVAVREQSAAAGREDALRRDEEERRQAAEGERQAAEREAALRREQEERQQAAEREAALRREQEERQQAAERERQKAEREVALRREQEERRRENKARQLAAVTEAARSAPPTPSQAVQGADTASSAASPRSFGPAEIAATRAFTRF